MEEFGQSDYGVPLGDVTLKGNRFRVSSFVAHYLDALKLMNGCIQEMFVRPIINILDLVSKQGLLFGEDYTIGDDKVGKVGFIVQKLCYVLIAHKASKGNIAINNLKCVFMDHQHWLLHASR